MAVTNNDIGILRANMAGSSGIHSDSYRCRSPSEKFAPARSARRS